MLEYLRLVNVGPAPEMELEFAERLNLITGDNGLGKSFLLDVAWWALTRRWPVEVNPSLTSGFMARPARRGPASIEFSFHAKVKRERYRSEFNRREEAWTGRPGRPSNPGLVLYAQADGGFAVWDPHRNYWKTTKNADVQERQPAYVFSAKQVWEGLPASGVQLCNGLITDWALWQKEGGEAFRQLTAVLGALSPTDVPLVPGALSKRSVDDSRWDPTIRMPYQLDVPLIVASAAIKRIVALAYVLVWSWQEHVRAAELLDEHPTNQVTFLIDEVESHLHPKWQRTIIKSLLDVMSELAGGAAVQLIVATHSPLFLASLEPHFDAEKDAWFDLDLEQPEEGAAEVVLRRRPFLRRGDVSNWLTSEAFDLRQARSVEAERVLEEAAVALSDENFDALAAQALDAKLREVLGDIDPFWSRWRFVGEKKGWLQRPDAPAPKPVERSASNAARRRGPRS